MGIAITRDHHSDSEISREEGGLPFPSAGVHHLRLPFPYFHHSDREWGATQTKGPAKSARSHGKARGERNRAPLRGGAKSM